MKKIKCSYSSPLVLTHDLIGGKWKLRILWHIINGDNRFSLLNKAMPDISQKVLVSQLKELEESGLIQKEIIDDSPPKIIEYHVSKEREKIIGLVKHIFEFTDGYAANNEIVIEKEAHSEL